MKSLRTWLLNCGLLAGSLGLALGLTEVAVRLLAPQPTGLSHQDRYGLAMHYPGITRYLPQFGHDVTFNSVGMRDREHELQKPPGVFRVLILGDSFMEGLQVPFDSSFPALLERGLAAGGRRVEVINAGVGGWGNDDELRYLTMYGLRYQPDLVVVAMTLHNDISDNLRQQWHTLRAGALVDRPVVAMTRLQYGIVQVKAFIATRWQLYQLWRRVRHGGEMRSIARNLNSYVTELFRDPTPAPVSAGMDLTAHLLAAIRDTARSAGAKTALVLLPIKYQLSDSAFAAFMGSNQVPLTEVQQDKPQQMVQHLADSLGIPVVDLLPAFRKWTAERRDPLYLEWDGHWNEAGHHLAGVEATKGLLAQGLMP